jgi:hypothetical protein
MWARALSWPSQRRSVEQRRAHLTLIQMGLNTGLSVYLGLPRPLDPMCTVTWTWSVNEIPSLLSKKILNTVRGGRYFQPRPAWTRGLLAGAAS